MDSLFINKSDNIFLAGHNGLVGSAFKNQLQKDGYKNIFTIDKKNLDLRKEHEVKSYLSQNNFDLVIIAAAKVGGVLANFKNAVEFFNDNIQIQNNLINNAYLNNINKLIFLGSSCIYPKNINHPIKEEDLLTGELEKTNEAYALAKITGLKLCNYYNIKHNTSYRCLMPTNLYGENDNFDTENGHVIPSLIKKFYIAETTNSNIEIWGSGNAKREFLYVNDLADALSFILKLNDKVFFNGDKTKNTHINVGTGNDISIMDLVNILKTFFKIKGKIFYDKSKLEGVPRKLLDITKISSMGWKPKTNLNDGLSKTINFFRNNIANK